MMVFVAGGFLLLLFDPVVRKTGPAPTLWILLLVAFSLSFLTVRALAANPFLVRLVGILHRLGIMIALILSLANKTNVGAWLGGLAVLVPLLILAFSLLGYPF
jgi:hypothetical protein